MNGRRFPVWAVLALVLVLALLVGSGAFSSTPSTPSQRALSIESDIRCPSCEDLSVADSSAQTAITARATIRQLIAEGKTDQQIKAYLASRYGTAIVLVPPASGWSLLVWVLPLAGGALSIGVLATVLVRKRRAAYEDPAEAAAAEVVADAGAGSDQLHERRRFLEQSLADARAEHRAGDLSDRDYQALRGRDTARLAALQARIAEVAAPDGAAPVGAALGVGPGVEPGVTPIKPRHPARTRRQRVFLGGAITAFGVAAVLVVALFAGNRLPGQTPTGSVSLSQQQQVEQMLEQAASYENDNRPGQAAQLYQKVLDANPKNEVALAQLGWLEYQTGQSGKDASLIGDSRAKLNRAVQLDPGDYAARLYLGTLLLEQDNDASGAVAQYQEFLADDPPTAVLNQAAPTLRQAYHQAGVALPSQVPAT